MSVNPSVSFSDDDNDYQEQLDNDKHPDIISVKQLQNSLAFRSSNAFLASSHKLNITQSSTTSPKVGAHSPTNAFKADYLRTQFIEKKLPSFFGVVAMKQQRSMVAGRHPKSLKKESELWHYAKNADERRKRIKNGHSFWGTIAETTEKQLEVLSTDPCASPKNKRKERERQRGKLHIQVSPRGGGITGSFSSPSLSTMTRNDSFLSPIRPGSAETVYSAISVASTSSAASAAILSPLITKKQPINGLSSVSQGVLADSRKAAGTGVPTQSQPRQHHHNGSQSIQSQLKSVLSNSIDDLLLKIDFEHRSLINYNMAFLIMNYNDEVLFVDKDSGEFRTKPLKELLPTDKAKFKMIDMLNPSNPKALHFGDDLWLQALPIVAGVSPFSYSASHSGLSSTESVVGKNEDTFQYGSAVIAKLYDPIEVSQVQFNSEYLASSILESTKSALEKHQKQ
jgi:hypothetical protein